MRDIKNTADAIMEGNDAYLVLEVFPPVDRIAQYMSATGVDTHEKAALIRDIVLKAERDRNPQAVDQALDEINKVIGGHGVEAITGRLYDPHYRNVTALYVNAGTTHSQTVVYDTAKKVFLLTTPVDFMDKNRDEYGIEGPMMTVRNEDSGRGRVLFGEHVGSDLDTFITPDLLSARMKLRPHAANLIWNATRRASYSWDYSSGSYKNVDYALGLANKIIGGSGIKAITGFKTLSDSHYADAVALYVNVEDPDEWTILYDTEDRSFHSTTVSEFVKAYGTKYGIK